MSTISAASSASYTSPKQRLLDTISNQVSTGKISSTDQTGLESAVDDIDTSLSSSASSSTTSLDPSQMKSRIDGLISKEVENGTLTSDQAETLKSVLASGGGRGGEGEGGVGGVGGRGGPPPGPPPSGGAQDSASDTTSSDEDSTTTATASSDGMSASDLLASFMKQLQSSMSQSTGYSASGATGSSGGTKLTSALLLNFEA